MPNPNLALLAAVQDAIAKRTAFLANWKALDAAAVRLALECSYVPDPGIPPLIAAGDKARKAMGTAWAGWDKAMTQSAGLALAYEEPPVIIPPEVAHGCPPGIELIEWTFKPVDGAGRPTLDGSKYDLIPNWVAGAHLTGFRFTGNPADNYYAGSQGIAGTAPNVRVSNAIIDRARKWHGRPHKVKGLVVDHVSDINGPEEHDWYIEPIGGQLLTEICFQLSNGYSSRSGSQRFQLSQRSRDGITDAEYADGGMIVIQNDLCVDHARHTSEGGTGTRASQAYKFFSAQVGPAEGNEVNRLLRHYVLLDRVTLDDTMQKWSHGAALIGSNKGTVITGSSFRGGSLNSHPDGKSYEVIRVESWITPNPSGPLLIENSHFEYTSGEGGQGIKLFDDRPVMIRNCTGNLRVYDANGQPRGLIRDGFARNWTPAAENICNTIKAAAPK